MIAIAHILRFCFLVGFVIVALLNAIAFNWGLEHQLSPNFLYSSLFFLDFAIGILLYDFAKQAVRRSLAMLEKALAERTSSDLSFLQAQDYPQEFQAMLHELNQMLLRIQAYNDRNKRFSADAAHELRTPMTALKTQAQLALEMTEPQEQRKAMENVIISVNRGIHVIQQLLTLSRLDYEKKLNDASPQNLENICAELIAFMYPQALEKNIEIELSNEATQSTIQGNESALGILLRNLIDNAIRYSPNNARIEVKIKEHNQYILLQVVDNGPGISEEYYDKVFNRFFRLLGTKQTGSGLGLAIVKQITDLHKAKIYLQKSELNQGLTVTVVFRKSRP